MTGNHVNGFFKTLIPDPKEVVQLRPCSEIHHRSYPRSDPHLPEVHIPHVSVGFFVLMKVSNTPLSHARKGWTGQTLYKMCRINEKRPDNPQVGAFVNAPAESSWVPAVSECAASFASQMFSTTSS